jgi:hypothetical protein
MSEQAEDGTGDAAQDVAEAATGQDADGAASGDGGQAQSDGATGENANGGRRVTHAVDQSGDIVEITLNDNGEIVGEELVGNIGSLPVEEEYTDEAGRNVSRVRDESGHAFEHISDDEGNIVGVRAV